MTPRFPKFQNAPDREWRRRARGKGHAQPSGGDEDLFGAGQVEGDLML
jgi:hypothetical protein